MKTENTLLRKAFTAIILILFISVLPACGGKSDARVIIAGSTSVQPYAEVLAEEYASLFPKNEIDVQGGGSAAGIMAAETGAANIGMSSRALREDEKGLWAVEIAKDGLAVIVNPKNPVSDLTLEQIRNIYTAEISNWGELGGPEAKIHIIAREAGSGTRSAFEDLVMSGYEINPKAIVQNSNGAVRQLVSGDPNSIGFISLGLVDHTVKAVALEGVEASMENIFNESYSLFRPFLFVVKSAPEGLTAEFIDFVLSTEGKNILSDEGLIPY